VSKHEVLYDPEPDERCLDCKWYRYNLGFGYSKCYHKPLATNLKTDTDISEYGRCGYWKDKNDD